MLGDREREYAHEESSDAAAQAARLQMLLTESAKGSVELPRASLLISRMFKDVQENIETLAAIQTRGQGGKYKSWLRAIPSSTAAIISIRQCIELCTSSTHKTHVHMQDLAMFIGKLFELEVRIAQAEKVNPMYMQKVHNQIKTNASANKGHIRNVYGFAIKQVMKGEIEFSLTRSDIIHIGKFGVDACVQAGLIEAHRGVNKSGSTVEYVLHPEVNDFLIGYTANDVRNIIAREDMRMYCPPEPWTNLTDGGYLTTRRKAAAPLLRVRDIRKSDRARVASEFTAENMPVVFEAGNYMQSIPYSIHQPTRDAVLRVWHAGGGMLGVPKKNPPERPEMPLAKEWVRATGTDDELKVFGEWKRKAVQFYSAMRTWRGKVREIGAFVKSSIDTDVPLWFPMYLDTRGRWYYRGSPNPQGSDLAKGVLHFHTKKPLGSEGLYWVKVAIANNSGFDKDRFDERARWTDQNWGTIERALDRPEDFPEVWGTDAPWCVFSAAWELREALRSGNPAAYKTGLIIHMDATCSGLQHFSALLRDPVGGRYVNLSDDLKCGPKQDIYARVAQNAMAVIAKDAESSDEEVSRVAQFWLGVGLPRALAKKPVMTFVYGATLKGTAEYIEEYVHSEMPNVEFPVHKESLKYCMYAARKLFQGIAATVPAAKAAMDWLRAIAKQQPNGKRMEWRTPTGFLVQHDYQDYADNRVKINSCGVTHVMVREYTEDTKASSMQNAISPNFVHALDASHLTLTAHKMKQGDLQIVGIHDSFGTHPCSVSTLHGYIRTAFVEMYSNRNILAEFQWDVQGVGEVPERFTLDLNKVLESEFFFC